MAQVAKTRLSRGLFLDRDIEQFREQLSRFRPFLSKTPPSSVAEFDQTAERLIASQ